MSQSRSIAKFASHGRIAGRLRCAAMLSFAAATLFFNCACQERAAFPQVAAGQPFPQIMLARLADAQPVTPESWRGRNIVLNIWATWCEPCRKEMPSLERLARESSGDPVVIGIATDSDLNLAREFVLRYGITFQNLSDPEGRATRDALGIKTLPETFLIDANGVILARISGAREWSGAELRRAFSSAAAPK
jgi:thiol-disulfide isomerase/thioredoxin